MCKCYKNFGEFPKEFRYVLSELGKKKDLIETLSKSTMFNWSDIIIRLRIEVGGILMSLPKDIRESWEKVQQKEIYRKKWAQCYADGNTDDAKNWLEKYNNVFKCKGCCDE